MSNPSCLPSLKMQSKWGDLKKLKLRVVVSKRTADTVARGARPYYAEILSADGAGWVTVGDGNWVLYGNGNTKEQAIINLAGYIRGCKKIKINTSGGPVYYSSADILEDRNEQS